MPDVQYEPQGVKKTCAAFSQKISVLWPLLRRRSLHDQAVIDDVLLLLRRWRKRVSALKEAGWETLDQPGKVQFLRNCPPSIAVLTCEKSNRKCNMWHFCPWCFSRKTEEVFNKFAALLPNRGANKNSTLYLLEISNREDRTRKDVGRRVDAPLQQWAKIPKAVLKRLKSEGAYYSVELAPRAIHGQKSMWRFSYHILAIVPEGWSPPAWLDNGRRKIRLTAVRSKKDLVNVVARVRKYPIGLMTADPRLVRLALNARRGMKCSAWLGSLRQAADKLEG